MESQPQDESNQGEPAPPQAIARPATTPPPSRPGGVCAPGAGGESVENKAWNNTPRLASLLCRMWALFTR